jgi:hypothetical protein
MDASNDYADEQNIDCIAVWYSIYKIFAISDGLLAQCNALVLLWTQKKWFNLALAVAIFPLMSAYRYQALLWS